MSVLLAAPTKNAIQKTLAAQLLNTASTSDPITFDDVDGIANLPGVLVINRVDSSGVATPSKREYIEYSGTSGSTVIITTRNVDGSSSALTHAVGSIVEFIPDVVWADRIYDSLATLVDVNDISSTNTSIVTLTGTQTLTNKTLTTPTINTINTSTNTDLTLSPNGTGLIKGKTTVELEVFSSGTDTETGDAKRFFRIPGELDGMNLVGIAGAVYTAGTTGTTDIQIRNKTQTADMLTTKLTIDSGETDSSTAATAAVIDTANDDVAEADIIAIDIDAVSTTAAQGLVVSLTFATP